MKDRLGWTASNAGLASAQARLSGDQEMQSMLDLIARANLLGPEALTDQSSRLFGGAMTGPALSDSENVFERSFIPRSTSPEPYEGSVISPTNDRKPNNVTWNLQRERSRELETGADNSKMKVGTVLEPVSESSSRTPTDESRTTAKTSPPATRRQSLKRTYTDTSPLNLQNKLMDAMAQPYVVAEPVPDQIMTSVVPSSAGPSSHAMNGSYTMNPAVHGHAARWAPAAQAIFTTEAKSPYTILAANDLACLVFGVTKAEVRKMGILEVVQPERRAWLEEKLEQPGSEQARSPSSAHVQSQQPSPTSTTSFLLGRAGVTAQLLSKGPSWQQKSGRRAQTDDGAGSSLAARKKAGKGNGHHANNKSRGVLLCGDIVPIRKRNGVSGSASLWVKEKRGGLIWVLEEIHEDVAFIKLEKNATVKEVTGSIEPIWGEGFKKTGMDIGTLLPRIPRQGIDPRTGALDYAEISKRRYFTARNSARVNIPAVVERIPDSIDLRVSSFPHIAGIIVLTADDLKIKSSNSVFSSALFGQEQPDGLPITDLIPDFDDLLNILSEENGHEFVDGMVIPEHSFRRARTYLALREGKLDPASIFLHPDGLPAKHRDGSEINIDVQMRVVQSDRHQPVADEHVIEEEAEDEDEDEPEKQAGSELVYALWITYSRHLHANRQAHGTTTPGLLTGAATPMRQPSPGQTEPASPVDMDSEDEPKQEASTVSTLTKHIKDTAVKAAQKITGQDPPTPAETESQSPSPPPVAQKPAHKKTIDDFVILEDMGQGAYGQVKLARFKEGDERKVVLKYVTKRRILVDTWTRDRRLGTVPLEIHVLDYLRRDGLKHPNIVEMSDFFEDDINYYIEMVPHGLPGMDLFDYIELRQNMEEAECKSIFIQVARAIHHLHTKALVVHRDIKDENIVLDGRGNIKLIDFGSAAYIKSGPFDVFVGTIGKYSTLQCVPLPFARLLLTCL